VNHGARLGLTLKASTTLWTKPFPHGLRVTFKIHTVAHPLPLFIYLTNVNQASGVNPTYTSAKEIRSLISQNLQASEKKRELGPKAVWQYSLLPPGFLILV
jgi:hypothetical protein